MEGRPCAHTRWSTTWTVAIAAILGFTLLSLSTVQARTFHCRSGDAACLIAAIKQANVQPGPRHEIRLAAGTYTLTTVDNETDGPNGLPSITSQLTIRGVGTEATIIERNDNAPSFRLLHVAPAGTLTLKALTLRGGLWGIAPLLNQAEGGGIYNRGTLTLTHSILSGNGAVSGSNSAGGAVFNDGGTVTITHSTLSGNHAGANGFAGGGAVFNDGGTVTITHSTLVDNVAVGGDSTGGGLLNGGTATIINSTLAGNSADGGGALLNGGTARIINSTLSGNMALAGGILGGGGGLWNFDLAVVELQNTIVALNFGGSPDCQGLVTSLNNNLIGDPTNCAIALQDSDVTGDPGLADFTDDGTPGRGYFPLLPGSEAIDAGNDAACPSTDQLEQPRVGICDIGAVEFQGEVVSSRLHGDARRWIGP